MPITSTIVNVNATVTAAPTPSGLQQSGALVSTLGTTLAANSYQFCSSLAQVVALLSTQGNYLELQNMATTFFAQGNAVGVWVLETGLGGTNYGLQITTLQTWINANPNIFYGYLCPAIWDTVGATMNTMALTFAGPTGKTYFFMTSTSGTLSAYATTKSIVATVPSPTAAGTEFQAAALFYQFLVNDPDIASPAAPMTYRFVFGVTPWSLLGNQATINAILNANGNLIISGAEGGISTSIISHGTTQDGQQMMWWYAVDYILIQSKLLLANAIINAANENPPIYYNQFGINALLEVIKQLGTSAISFGLLLSGTFSAVPFTTYTQAHPADYNAGVYNGFSAVVTPQNSFESITFNLNATQFAFGG